MNFEDFNLKPQIMKAVKGMGYTEPTDIQVRCIPLIREGKDVVAQSSTGSGKTAAFALPILEKMETGRGIQVLVLTPTRELCVQVNESFEIFGRHLGVKCVSVYGGVSINPQIDALRRANIVVGTPGRMLDHLERGTVALNKVQYLVIDEADKMFEMGFIEDVEKIISQVSANRQTMLFSATISSEIHGLVKRYLRSPANVKTQLYVDKSLLKQVFYNVPQKEKFSFFVHLIKGQKETGIAMVFVATRREADIIARNLKGQGIRAMAIHGGLSQNQRLHALDALKTGDITTLVATDVAARGLDIRNVTHVYNYDVPKTSEEYVHRIGRTARAGMEGDAVTLLTERDYENFNNVLRDHTLEIKKAELPHFERVQFEARSQGDRRGGFERKGGFSRGGPRHGGREGGREGGRGFSREGGRGFSREGSREGGNRREGGYSRDGSHSGSRFGGRSRDSGRDGGREGGRGFSREGSSDRGSRREFSSSRAGADSAKRKPRW
jgi:ATP-dependent RNA helicase DeaD